MEVEAEAPSSACTIGPHNFFYYGKPMELNYVSYWYLMWSLKQQILVSLSTTCYYHSWKLWFWDPHKYPLWISWVQWFPVAVSSTAKLHVVWKEETPLPWICFPPYVFECLVCSVNERRKRDVSFYVVHLFILFYHVFISIILCLGKHTIGKHNAPSLQDRPSHRNNTVVLWEK